MKLLIWDFDNTLAYRDGMWSGALIEVLDCFLPQHDITRDRVRSYLRHGFPWHAPDVDRRHLRDPDAWWAALRPLFAEAFCGCGVKPDQARQLAWSVRAAYCDPARWKLFDDAVPALAGLAGAGWSHVILSNHVPELPLLVRALALEPYIAAVYTSAAIGFEKPRPEAFRAVLSAYPTAASAWMIGDSWTADILGAAAVGLPAILVRSDHPEARYRCASLAPIATIVEANPESSNAAHTLGSAAERPGG